MVLLLRCSCDVVVVLLWCGLNCVTVGTECFSIAHSKSSVVVYVDSWIDKNLGLKSSWVTREANLLTYMPSGSMVWRHSGVLMTMVMTKLRLRLHGNRVSSQQRVSVLSGDVMVVPRRHCLSMNIEQLILETCESEISVGIESRIESAATIRIRIESWVKSGCSVWSFTCSLATATGVVYAYCVLPGTTLLHANYYRRIEMCRFFWFFKQYCTIAPTVIASVYILLLHKNKINLNYNGATIEVFFCWKVSVVCGTTYDASCSESARHFRMKSNRNRPIRISKLHGSLTNIRDGSYFAIVACDYR